MKTYWESETHIRILDHALEIEGILADYRQAVQRFDISGIERCRKELAVAQAALAETTGRGTRG